MNKLDTFLSDMGLDRYGDVGLIIRHLIAEDKADEWKREADAAMERRARLNGPHKFLADTLGPDFEPDKTSEDGAVWR